MINITINSTAVVGASILTMSDNGDVFKFGDVVMLKKRDCVVVLSCGDKQGQKVRLPLEYPIGGATVDGINYVIDLPEVVHTERTPKVKLAPGEKTKIQMCRELYAQHIGSDPETIKQLFVDEAKCTPLGANTYYLSIKKNG